jgi:hypothetical protein
MEAQPTEITTPPQSTPETPAVNPSTPEPPTAPEADRQAEIQRAVEAALRQQRSEFEKGQAAELIALEMKQTREKYLREKMADLPRIYRESMPTDTSDPNQLAAAEQKIREEFIKDYRALGFKTPDVGGDVRGGEDPMQSYRNFQDRRKPHQKIGDAVQRIGFRQRVQMKSPVPEKIVEQ